jgi:hypothetical protein
MIITDAILKAASEHAVYFLLTAYLEAVRAPIPASVSSFPIRGRDDVAWRLKMLLEAAQREASPCEASSAAIEEATVVFSTALRQLEILSVPQHPNASGDARAASSRR